MIYNVSNVPQLRDAVTMAQSGDEIRISAGTYDVGTPLTFASNYSESNPLVITASPQAKFFSVGRPRTLDLRGTNIIWDGGEIYGGNLEVVGILGDGITLRNADVHGGYDVLKANRGIGLIGKNNTIHGCKIHDFGNIGIDGNGGRYNDIKVILQEDNPHELYRSSQNWKIYDNDIYNIDTNAYGHHHGAMKLVPGVKDVYIWNNRIDNTIMGIWLDRPEGNVVIYNNKLTNMTGKAIFYEISDDFRDPYTPPSYIFGCYILKNTVLNSKHAIWVSGSSNATVIGNITEGELPSGGGNMPREFAKIGGVAGTGLMAHFQNNIFKNNVFKVTKSKVMLSVYDHLSKSDPNAGNNIVEGNYYVPGQIIFNNNIYDLTEPTFNFETSKGIANHVSHQGIQHDPTGLVGPMITTLPWTDEEMGIPALLAPFPFITQGGSNPIIDIEAPSKPSNVRLLSAGTTTLHIAWNSSTDNIGVIGYDVIVDGVSSLTTTNTTATISNLTPNTEYQIEIIAKDSANNKTISDMVVLKTDQDIIITPPPVNTNKKDVIVFTDYSEGDTDPDDHVSMSAFLLTANDELYIRRMVVGCHQVGIDRNKTYQYDSPLELYNNTHGAAFEQEKTNLGYTYTPEVRLADTHRKRISRDNPSAGTNIKEIAEILKQYSPTKPLYMLNWGIMTELAILVKYLMETPGLQDLKNNLVIVSHYTHTPTANNYGKDPDAAAYLKNLAGSGMLKFIELGPSGSNLIDDRNASTGEMSPDVMLSKIGNYFKEKWIEPSTDQPGRPDFSDYSSAWCLFDKFGFGQTFLSQAKTNGQNNFTLFETLWKAMKTSTLTSKEVVYKFIEDQALKARNGDTGGGGNDPICPDCDSCCPDCPACDSCCPPNNTTDPRITKLLADLTLVINGLKDLGLL